MLIEHRVDDVDERLVAGEDPVPAAEEVALEHALAHVLGEHLDDATVTRELLVASVDADLPVAPGDLEDVLQPVAGELVGSEGEIVRRIVAGHLA